MEGLPAPGRPPCVLLGQTGRSSEARGPGRLLASAGLVVRAVLGGGVDLGSPHCGRPEELCQEVGVGSWEGNVLISSYQVHACVLSHFSCVRLSVTPSTVACQAPLSMGFSRPEYWSGLPCPPPRDLPNPGIKPVSIMSPALPGGFFTISASWEASYQVVPVIK